MKRILVSAIFVIAAGAFAATSALPQGDEPDFKQPSADEMKKMFEDYKRVCTPGAMHKKLEAFLGEWDTVRRVWMGGPGQPPLEMKGTASHRWLMDGRWLAMESKTAPSGNAMVDSMMPAHTFSLLGHDNYKRKFVWNMVDDKTTTCLSALGNWTQDNKALILYGPMDEPMTGEHDKTVKYVYRFSGPDKFTLEVHDLVIGETNTKVVEAEFTRKKK